MASAPTNARVGEFDRTRDRFIAVGNLIGDDAGSERILDLLAGKARFLSVRGQEEHLLAVANLSTDLAEEWASREYGWHAALSMDRTAKLNAITAGLPATIEVP